MSQISRRSISVGVLASSIGVSCGAMTLLNGAANAQAGPDISPEKWMSVWMAAGRPVSGGLFVGRFKDPTYFLTQAISWKLGPGQEKLKPVVAPKGFVTNLASIPRIFGSALRPDGKFAYAAIIHDYLYWVQETSREQADEIFKFAMEDFKIGSATIATIYNAVRTFGGPAWQQNSDDRARGERHVLRRFAEDPRLTWAEWKKDPDVFMPGSI